MIFGVMTNSTDTKMADAKTVRKLTRESKDGKWKTFLGHAGLPAGSVMWTAARWQ